MADNLTKDIWSPLGEESWRKLAEGTAATELQIRFAAARFSGASASGAAKLAGYSGDADSIRRAGYSALRSTQVQNLLELASVAAPKEGKISDAEIDAKISRLIRSGDPNVCLKAAALHAEREKAKKDAGAHPEDDGLEDWRTCRDYLLIENGATAFMAMFKAARHHLGWLGNYPLLHDVYHAMKKEPMGQAMWDWCCSNCSDDSRKELERHLANPHYQLKARLLIWRELNRAPLGPHLTVISGEATHAA